MGPLLNKFRGWMSFLLQEAWPLIILLCALTIEFAHIANSPAWLQLFLYNGDSLTLPFIRQTIMHHDPFLWVSSSQFLFFPEGLLYAISSLFTTSIRASLVFNGSLNIILIYLLFRWSVGTFHNTALYLKQIYATGCTLLLLAYMLLERQALINSSSVATIFIFTSYYYGVILSGGYVLCVMLELLKHEPVFKKLRSQIFLALSGGIIALISNFSDPLFTVQFVIPMVGAISIVVILNGIQLRKAFYVFAPVLIGALLGYLARLLFRPFLGDALKDHLFASRVRDTLAVFHNAVSINFSSGAGFLELFLVCLVILFSISYSGWWVYQMKLNQKKSDPLLLLISLFAVLSAIITILFSIFSGSKVTRYLLPVYIFPLFGLMPLVANKTMSHIKKPLLGLSLTVAILVFIVGIISLPSAKNILSEKSYAGAKCLSRALDGKPANGVGPYWLTRSLYVYGEQDQVALQVDSKLHPFLWQANLGSYLSKRYSFVVVDKNSSSGSLSISPSNPNIPINPYKIFTCSDMYIYIYKPGTPGYKRLNESVSSPLESLRRIRSTGKTSELF